jgi:hypothetical protein
MAGMTSRERVQTVLNHQESDRVPLLVKEAMACQAQATY